MADEKSCVEVVIMHAEGPEFVLGQDKSKCAASGVTVLSFIVSAQ